MRLVEVVRSGFRSLAVGLVLSILPLPVGYVHARPQGDGDRPRQAAEPRRDAAEAHDDEARKKYPELDLPPRRSPKRFDMRPRFERDRFGYRFGIPAFEAERREALERAYLEGLEEGRLNERLEMQSERGLNSYQEAMAAGQAAFFDGDYGLAARHFLLAATLHQGDPSARLCAAHTYIALGDYASAMRLIERAMELEPRIVYLPMDLRGAYGEWDDFVRHVRALQQATEESPEDAELWFLLGYCRYFSKQMKESVVPLSKAAELAPDDRMVGRLSDLAKTVSGRAEKKTPAKP